MSVGVRAKFFNWFIATGRQSFNRGVMQVKYGV